MEPPACGPGGSAVSPYSTVTAPTGTPSASAAICAVTVAAPTPISLSPQRTTTEPSTPSRTLTSTDARNGMWNAVATPSRRATARRAPSRGCGARPLQPNRSAPRA